MVDLPTINVGPLAEGGSAAAEVARQLDAACREFGFFYLTGHGVDPGLQAALDTAARQFFDLSASEKKEVAMDRGGRAWRGWFPLGGELTAGVPDQKEGLYFGTELGPDDRRVRAGTVMHGPNLFPRRPPELRAAVTAYMAAMRRIGEIVLQGIGLGLGLGPSWFVDHLTSDPLMLFRIFRYPALADGIDDQWNVGEHTDYGLLTILGQDASGGLQVKTPGGWIEVPPRPGTFVCNLGDMLERLTGSSYCSTVHRVRNAGTGDRLSFPFFFDPSWDAVVERLPIVDRPIDDDAAQRWDHVSVHGYEGTYGDYICSKVRRVFPDLDG